MVDEVPTISLNGVDDFHLHLRTGSVCETVAPISASQFGYVLVMPNTSTPILTDDDVVKYRCEIERQTQEPPPQGCSYEDLVNWNTTFHPLMTIKLTPRTKVEDLRLAMLAGAIAAKLYPEGATTGSDDSIKIDRFEDLRRYNAIFREMERLRMVLSIHGELPDYPDLEREIAFLPVLRCLAKKYKQLKIVMEHVTSTKGIELVKELGPNVAGTLTVHHMLLTHGMVFGHNHLFCRPAARYASDCGAVIQAAISGNPKFFFGSDSAPHIRIRKECADAAAGIFTSPVALPLLAQVFEAADALGKLKGFLCLFGKQFYGLPIPKKPKRILLVRDSWTVPREYDGIVPFMAGQTLPWRVQAA